MSKLSPTSPIDLRVVSSGPTPAGRRLSRSVLECLDKLRYTLQRSLEPQFLLQQFGDTIAELIPWDGLVFVNDAEALNYQAGIIASHGCEYRLSIDDTGLGELRLSRRTRYTELELELLERFLGVLIYPLRNALMYQRALANALKDGLTGLSNRLALSQTLERELQLARRHQTPLSLIVVDVDHFKAINDRYGHSVGDQVLRCIARRLGEMVRSTDMVFRYGGEEFVILLSNTELEGARLLAERIRIAVEESVCQCQTGEVHMTLSAGVANLRPESATPEQLFDQADGALYAAKSGGRNRVCTSI